MKYSTKGYKCKTRIKKNKKKPKRPVLTCIIYRMATKKTNVKPTIEEYKKLQELKNKRRFKIEWYPWPVMTALLIPLTLFLLLILFYVIEIKTMSR